MKKTTINIVLLLGLALLLTGCGGSSSGGGDPAPGYNITLKFIRGDGGGGLDPFTVTATITKDGTATAGLSPTVTLGRGSQGGVTDMANGDYQFTVTPTQTGEHAVTVVSNSASITRTALVLFNVDAGWEQPMSVSGLVNTEGYEDGVTISPDGEYLFVQTSPNYFSAFFVYNAPVAMGGCGGDLLVPPCAHPYIDTLAGPYTAPERPGYFDGRFNGNLMRHNSNLYGVADGQAPIFAFASMFYGFKKQADGSFKQPFYIAFEDENDAIMNPFGMSFRMNNDGTATMIFAFDDPALDQVQVDPDSNGSFDVDSGFDVYTTDITLGQNNILGQYVPGVPVPAKGASFASTLVGFDAAGPDGMYGTQGNPHLYYLADGTIHSIWTDDEYDLDDMDPGNDADAGDLSVYVQTAGTFPAGTWTKQGLPANINATGDQIQPFFTGSGLFFTQDVDIMYSAYSGTDTLADYANNAYWATPVKILEKDAGTSPLGKIIAIGEPTIANVSGTEYLYFVYAYVRAVDGTTNISDMNMQAGYIKKRP